MPEFFIANNEKFYREFEGSEKDNIRKRDKPYFMFEDAVSNEKILGRVNRIHKTFATHYYYRHIHVLYSLPNIKPLSLTIHNKISNFMFGDISTPISDGVSKIIIKKEMEECGPMQGNMR
jgi:hypothetical protein